MERLLQENGGARTSVPAPATSVEQARLVALHAVAPSLASFIEQTHARLGLLPALKPQRRAGSLKQPGNEVDMLFTGSRVHSFPAECGVCVFVFGVSAQLSAGTE